MAKKRFIRIKRTHTVSFFCFNSDKKPGVLHKK